jgi:hypothetical protein
MSGANHLNAVDVEFGLRRAWPHWLWWFGGSFAATSIGLYLCVLLVDPFATGRFAITQRIDVATRVSRLAKAGIVRDQELNAAIFCSSMSLPLDPVAVGAGTAWRIAQLGIEAALPPNQLTVARAFERHHRSSTTLDIFILDILWCRPGDPDTQASGPFPTWLYESPDSEYLSRIFFPLAVQTAVVRIAIWLGLDSQRARPDGFVAIFPSDGDLRPAPPVVYRPVDAPPVDVGFPALDALADHVARRPAASAVAFVFVPAYIAGLPEEGSAAARRLQACKDRVRNLAERRPNTAYLDFMIDSPLIRNPSNFTYDLHYRVEVAHWMEPQIARALAGLRASID